MSRWPGCRTQFLQRGLALGTILASRRNPVVLSMQRAVSNARKKIKMALTETVEWATPVLHLRTEDCVSSTPRRLCPGPGVFCEETDRQ